MVVKIDQFNSSKVTSSLFWSGIEKFSVQGIGFIITLIISRLISPGDYGLIAMLSFFMVISQVLIDSGISNSLIQNQNRTDTDYSTVFLLNIAIGLICYITLFLCAPYIAAFYNQPILISITRVYALILIISSLTLVQRTRFYIYCKYRQLSLISIVSLIIAGFTAIFLALHGYGVWALVAYYLLQSLICSILIWIIAKWYPNFNFSKKSARRALSFGSKLLVANLIHAFTSNLYTLIIGKKYNSIDLGYYGRGQSISYIYPSNISNMISQAAYPILCELQYDTMQLKQTFINYIKTSVLLCFPLSTLLVALAEPLVSCLLGPKWLPAVPFVQILAIGYMFDPIMRLGALVLSVTGKSKYYLQAEIVKKIIMLLILLVTLSLGLMWMTWGLAIYSIFDLMIVFVFVKKIMPFSFFELGRILLLYMCYNISTYFLIHIITGVISSDLLKIIFGGSLGIIFYICMIGCFSRQDFYKIKDVMVKFVHKHS